jgi:hypothetical protein
MTDRPFDRFLMPKRAFPVRVVDTGTLVDAVVLELEDRFVFYAHYWKPMVVLKNTLSPIRSMDGLSDDFGDGTHAAFGWWLMHKTVEEGEVVDVQEVREALVLGKADTLQVFQ